MGSLSIWHWLIVLLIAVVVFGTKKLRGAGKDLGGAVSDFKSGMRGGEEAAKGATEAPPAAAPNVLEGEAKRDKV